MRSKRFLELCQELRTLGLELEVEPGCVVARGFADLGFELFNVLAGEKILSLFTGAISQIQPEYASHFFSVPDCDQLVMLMAKFGGVPHSIIYKDQREWQVSFSGPKSNSEHKATAPFLLEALACALKQILRDRDV